ncbi:MAG: aromatic amino acid transaminase [Pseudomonadales bacterium]
MFESLQPVPADPILHLAVMHREDSNPHKVDLGLGVYKDEQGHTPIMRAVDAAEQRILGLEDTKTYVGMAGWARYNQLIAEVVLGSGNAFLADKRLAIAQTPGGTGALRVICEFINAAKPGAKVWVGKPTWANHHAIIKSAGLTLDEFPYFDANTHSVDFDAMMAKLEAEAEVGDLVLVHGCCHNPSGADLNLDQWQAFAELASKKGLIPFVDIAYQGMGDGMEEDAAGLRLVADIVEEMVIASSCSKNFGLYRERTGTAIVLTKTADHATVVQGQMNGVIRGNYSMPPSHGALVVQTILDDAELKADWLVELGEVRERIARLRSELVQALNTAGVQQDFSFIERQKGMFSFLGVDKDQVNSLVHNHSVYLVGSSRINVAGLNDSNMANFAKAVAAVL